MVKRKSQNDKAISYHHDGADKKRIRDVLRGDLTVGMLRCALSGKNSIPGQSPVRVVTQTRQKTYVNYKEVIENEKKKLIEVISEGWEIVEEKLVLPDVAKE